MAITLNYRVRTLIEESESTDYSRGVTKEFSFTGTRTEGLSPHSVISAPTTPGFAAAIAQYGSIEGFTVHNSDTTEDLRVTWDDSNTSTTNIVDLPAGETLQIRGAIDPTAALNLMSQAASADVQCYLWLDATA